MTVNPLFHRILDRVFGRAEEINGGNRCPTYLFRWQVASCLGRRVYLHRFVGDDWSTDLHDHPKRFVSIGLWGSYLKETAAAPNHRKIHRWRAPWFRTFPASHQHRISTPWGECWTLVIVLKATREWGFWPNGKFMPWRDYVQGVGGFADNRKSCE